MLSDLKAGNKGIMTGVTKAGYVASFVDASKALKKPGDISAPVKTKYGYHVIKLVSSTPDKQQTYAEVHDRIVDRLKADFVEKAARKHVDEIKSQHVDANPDLVASLRSRYGTKAPTDPVSLGITNSAGSQP